MPNTTSTDPVQLFQDIATGDRFLVYGTERGIKIELRYEGDTLWMSQAQIAELFGIDRSVVTKHLSNIFDEEELIRDQVCAKNARTAADGKTYEVQYYNLDAVISVGYRVSSAQGTLFRKWATDTLVRFATKGFVIDSQRLKNSESDRIAELREIIRDIRSDEANVYKELKRICTMCSDYVPGSEAWVKFYAHMQAKIMHGVTSHTPSEMIISRANSDHENMGLRNWKGDAVTKADAKIAKNYLVEAELRELNRLTTILLDVFEDQLAIGRIANMVSLENLLNKQLANLGRPILLSGGRISTDAAHEHVEAVYTAYNERRREIRHAETDAALRALKAAEKKLPKTGGKR